MKRSVWFAIQPHPAIRKTRQGGEDIKILHTGDKILNSKCEYFSNNISRLTVLEEDWERRRKEREEEEERDRLELEKFEEEKLKSKKETVEISIHVEDLQNNEETQLNENPDIFRKPPQIRPLHANQ